MKRIYWVMLAIVVVVVLVGGYGVYNWTKPGKNIERADALPITADALVGAFSRDEHAANKTYLGKPLAVYGKVEKTATNQDGQTTILLGSSDPISGVFCTLRDKGVTANAGEMMTVKGFCSGRTTDVLLTDCVIARQ